jgi:hypothetical protein
MSPHQFFPQWRCVPDKAQDLVTVSTRCCGMHAEATFSRHAGVNIPSTVPKSLHISGYNEVRFHTAVPSSYSSRSYWSCSRLHGSPPTYRLGLPPDKDAECASFLNLPTGRDGPPDKEITCNCMNGSPGDPPGSIVQQSKQEENHPPHNPSSSSSALPCVGGVQSIFNHFLSTQNLSGKGTGSGTDARTCKQITVPK